MPTISAFYGIMILIYLDEHMPPHFHAVYAEYEASILIKDGTVISGFLPNKQLKIVLAWAESHRAELVADWQLAQEKRPLNGIDPPAMGVREDAVGLYPRVMQVVPTDDYRIYAYMNDGLVHLYDAKHLIHEGSVFAPLADIELFKSAATVIHHTVAWDIAGNRDERECLDIDPFTVRDAPAVDDPLEYTVKSA